MARLLAVAGLVLKAMDFGVDVSSFNQTRNIVSDSLLVSLPYRLYMKPQAVA
jgi:hypothetical protein